MFQIGSPGIEIRRYYEMKIENLFLSQSRPRGGRNPRPASASVCFQQKFIGPPSKSVLEADELPRPASASVRLRQKVVGPPSAFVLEADGVEESLPSVVLHRPASASVPGRPSSSRDPCLVIRYFSIFIVHHQGNNWTQHWLILNMLMVFLVGIVEKDHMPIVSHVVS